MFDHLLHFDCSDFDPQGKASETSSKLAMRHKGHSAAERFAAALRDEPEDVMQYEKYIQTNPTMRGKPKKLWRGDELWELAERAEYDIPSRNAMTNALMKMKFKQACNSNPIRHVGKAQPGDASKFKQDRLWVIMGDAAAFTAPAIAARQYSAERGRPLPHELQAQLQKMKPPAKEVK